MNREVPEFDAVPQTGWKPFGMGAVIAVAVVVIVIFAIRWASYDGWIPILDSANLALHEAGHPIIGIFSERLMVYGGTIFQLLFPTVVALHFARRREAVGCAMGTVWLGENLLNVARYMADARAQILPLVGGGEHDWTEIFLRWGVLQRDLTIAGFTRWLGYTLMLGAVWWLWRCYHKNKETTITERK